MNVSRETTPEAWLERAGVSRETLVRLQAYVDLLRHWNRRINLIGPDEPELIWPRHIADSLQLLPLLPAAGPFLDLGSGAGLPGLVLAIAGGHRFRLVEADQRKAAFLREAARACGAEVEVRASRIEALPPASSGLITARALAPLPRLLDLAAHLSGPGTVWLLPKGRNAEQELTKARRLWEMKVERHPSRTDRTGVVLRITEVARVRNPD